MTSEIPINEENQLPALFKWMGPAIAILVDGIHVAIIVVVIRVLRGDKVQNAMMQL